MSKDDLIKRILLKKKSTNIDFQTELSTHGENESKVLVLYTGGTIGKKINFKSLWGHNGAMFDISFYVLYRNGKKC